MYQPVEKTFLVDIGQFGIHAVYGRSRNEIVIHLYLKTALQSNFTGKIPKHLLKETVDRANITTEQLHQAIDIRRLLRIVRQYIELENDTMLHLFGRLISKCNR